MGGTAISMHIDTPAATFCTLQRNTELPKQPYNSLSILRNEHSQWKIQSTQLNGAETQHWSYQQQPPDTLLLHQNSDL